MAGLFFVSGGSASGKSAHAENLVVRLWNEEKASGRKDVKMIYAATMRVYGEEGRTKVERHRKLREGKGFFTIEQPLDIENVEVRRGDTVLLEDLANLLANEMYDEAGSHENCVKHITEGMFSLLERGCNIVCVSCEVFSDGIFYEDGTQRYLEYLGRIHQILAERADLAVELVCGIPVVYKDGQEKYDGKRNEIKGTDRIGRSLE